MKEPMTEEKRRRRIEEALLRYEQKNRPKNMRQSVTHLTYQRGGRVCPTSAFPAGKECLPSRNLLDAACHCPQNCPRTCDRCGEDGKVRHKAGKRMIHAHKGPLVRAQYKHMAMNKGINTKAYEGAGDSISLACGIKRAERGHDG